MIPFVGGLVLGFATNRWWIAVIPIGFGILIGSTINALSVITMSLAGLAGVALGIVARRFWDRRRTRGDAI